MMNVFTSCRVFLLAGIASARPRQDSKELFALTLPLMHRMLALSMSGTVTVEGGTTIGNSQGLAVSTVVATKIAKNLP